VAFLGAILRRKLFSGTPAIGETVRTTCQVHVVFHGHKFSDSNYLRTDDESVSFLHDGGDLWTRAMPA